jgi:hypothetical protein
MVAMVVLGYYGFSFFKTARLERYMHALGGITIFICGAEWCLWGGRAFTVYSWWFVVNLMLREIG